MATITFREATIDDAPLLRYWDSQPHVLVSGHDEDWNWEEELPKKHDWREMLIAEIDGRQIGIIQIIDPALEETHYWGHTPPNMRALDIWIGEPDDTGKGYGTEMMRQAIDRCFNDPAVTAILIDPLVTNVRAHRFYERLGFIFVENRYFADDSCLIFQLSRSEYYK